MADPTPYTISYSFSGWQSANPSRPLPAQNVDNELAGIQTSIASIIDALGDVRRSDGALQNGIVSFEKLDNDLKAGYSGGAVSAWAPVVDFGAGIVAQTVAPRTVVYYSGETYVCVVPHTTSSIFVPSNWKKIAARGVNGTGSGDMLAANNLSDVADVSQALANLGLDQVDNTTDANKPISSAAQAALDAITTQINDPWFAMPIGIPFPLMAHKGALAPPVDKAYRYVKLTAADAYNAGALTSESVSGSAPLVSATAIVSLAGSAMLGQTIRLLNTEGRFVRPSTSAGTLQDDAVQQFTGSLPAIMNGSGGTVTSGVLKSVETAVGVASTGASRYYSTLSIDAALQLRTATETRVRNEGVAYYMRVK